MESFNKKDLNNLQTEILEISKSLDLEGKEQRISELEKETSNPDLWKDQSNAKSILKEIEGLKKITEKSNMLKQEISTLLELGDESTIGLLEDYQKLKAKADKLGISVNEYQKIISKKAKVKIEFEE